MFKDGVGEMRAAVLCLHGDPAVPAAKWPSGFNSTWPSGSDSTWIRPATAPRGPPSPSLGAVVVCSSVASTQRHGRVGVRRPAGAEPVQGPRHYQRVRGPCSGRSGRAIAGLQCPICGSGRAAATPTQRCMIARCCGREGRGGQPCQALCSSAGVGQSRGSSGQPAWQLRRRAGAATQRQCGGRAVRCVLLCRLSAP